MPQTLDQRIAAAISADARAATVAELAQELDAQILEENAEFKRLDALSKSATSSEDEAETAADHAAKLSRKIARLDGKREQLASRLDELLNSERRKRTCAAHAEALARRDELAVDLREQVPALFAQLIGLLERLEASDAECAIVNRSIAYGLERIDSAEPLARCCPGNFQNAAQIPRLTKMKVPVFASPMADEMQWPRPYNAALTGLVSAEQSRQRAQR